MPSGSGHLPADISSLGGDPEVVPTACPQLTKSATFGPSSGNIVPPAVVSAGVVSFSWTDGGSEGDKQAANVSTGLCHATGLRFAMPLKSAGKSTLTIWAGVHAGRLKLRLAAPPVDDRANRECVAFVAKTLRLAKSKIRITRGHSSRQKTLVIDSATPEATAAQLRALAAKLESTSS